MSVSFSLSLRDETVSDILKITKATDTVPVKKFITDAIDEKIAREKDAKSA